MSGYLIAENLPAELWNSHLLRFSEGNFEQCFESGEIAEKAFPRAKAARLAITSNGKPVGLVQGTYSTYFGFGMTLKVRNGPVAIAENTETSLIAENLLRALDDYGKKNRIIQAEIWVPESWQLQEVFSRADYSLIDKTNEYYVNLGEDGDEHWRRIAHNKRRNIKRATKEGVEVILSDNHDDLLTFYSMLRSTAERAGFQPLPLPWFEAAWKLHRPGELSKIFFALWKGKKVAGVFTVTHGKTVYAAAAGSLTEGWKARPNDIMHWKAMEWARENGYSKYYMGLVSEPPPESGKEGSTPAWGVWRWKREWKGTLQKIQMFNKLLIPRYRLILVAKKLAERASEALNR